MAYNNNPFCIDDKFYTDIEDLLIDRELDEDDIKALPDDYTIEVEETTQEQMFQFTLEQIVNPVMQTTDRFEDRFPEDSESVDKDIENALKQGIDLEKINAAIPSLWYPNGNKIKLTKQDLLDAS